MPCPNFVRCFLAGLDAMIRSRQIVGKYRVERKLGEGGFATVYQAMDTIEGVRVALKIPCARYVDAAMLEDLRKEVRIVAQLNHSHILPLKNAEFIDGRFVLAFPLGERSLAERLQHRLSTRLALCFTEQILDAAAYAHQRRIIHCDIKPENMILFPGNQLLVTDFGIARVAQRTIQGSGSGTVGYIAPEQAMGKLSFRSDVFSIGLVSYRMFSGCRPEWPFSWPLARTSASGCHRPVATFYSSRPAQAISRRSAHAVRLSPVKEPCNSARWKTLPSSNSGEQKRLANNALPSIPKKIWQVVGLGTRVP
jgi:serine/threonine protein kinase